MMPTALPACLLAAIVVTVSAQSEDIIGLLPPAADTLPGQVPSQNGPLFQALISKDVSVPVSNREKRSHHCKYCGGGYGGYGGGGYGGGYGGYGGGYGGYGGGKYIAIPVVVESYSRPAYVKPNYIHGGGGCGGGGCGGGCGGYGGCGDGGHGGGGYGGGGYGGGGSYAQASASASSGSYGWGG